MFVFLNDIELEIVVFIIYGFYVFMMMMNPSGQIRSLVMTLTNVNVTFLALL